MGTHDGEVMLITGATSGIGRATALALATSGARLVLVGRDAAKTDAVVADVRARGGAAEALVGDLGTMAGVHGVADAYLSRFDRLDVLVNNAGAYFVKREVQEDGLERTFALDHVAYWLLTHRLLDLLRASAPSRVICTASDAHRAGSVHWDDLQLERGYTKAGFEAYMQAKLCNVLFAAELARRLEGSGVSVAAFHPGFVNSGFARNNGWLGRLSMALSRPWQRTPEQAAWTLAWLATAPEVAERSGLYWYDRKPRRPSAEAADPEAARRLWEITAGITGVDATRGQT